MQTLIMKNKTISLDIGGLYTTLQVHYTVENNVTTIYTIDLPGDLPILMSDVSDDVQQQILGKLK